MDPIRFDAPGEYVISVHGTVGQNLQDMIQNIKITVRDTERGPVSDIHAEVKDQAQLNGIMNMLYDCHLVILNVRKIGLQKAREQIVSTDDRIDI